MLIEQSKQKQQVTEITNLSKKNIFYQNQDEKLKIEKPESSALFILAGGAATRLGADCPKGLYQINLQPYNCILESLFAQMIELNKKYDRITPIILMLSEATKSTIETLKQRNYFNYPQEYIFYGFQDVYNVFDTKCQPLYQNQNEYQVSPNGNGGFLSVFGRIYDQNQQIFSKIKYIHCISVDNPFVKCCDTEMINFATKNNLQVVNRVLEIKNPQNCGIVGQKLMTVEQQAPLVPQNKQYLIQQMLQQPCMSVFEYTEIQQKYDDQKTQYANIANHLFETQFLCKIWEVMKEVNTSITPYHLALKKVNYYDLKQKEEIKPSEPNAYKIEHFIFDVFSFCPINRFGLFICNEDEFLPLKKHEDQILIETKWKQNK